MRYGVIGMIMGTLFFATLPSSSSYGLHNYSFGSGGTGSSSSTNYKLNGTTGETSNVQSTSSTYKARPGNNNAQQANVPNAPTFTNPASYYDKLKFIVNPGGTSPTDAKYTIAISTDNFTTTKYIQADNTIGVSKVYQTYAAWGGASGQNVIGLTPATTYQLKVNAIQGNFTETEYGPSASAATVPPSIAFNIFTDSQVSPPYTTALGNLLPATVTTAPNKIWIGLTTNADAGASVYVNSQFAGLHSTQASNTISSATANLSGVSTGYGAQNVSVTQTSGGPLTSVSPFNGAAQSVGLLNTLYQAIFATTAPITSGSGSFQVMAKAAASTPESNDYSDTLTLTAAASF